MSANKAPVFVLGCARSGTTLLYHMLLSAGGFAVYRAETHSFNILVPHFGDLNKRVNRQKLMKLWLQSYQFRISGLDAQEIESRILSQCHTGGDFLRIVMEEIAQKQGMQRWAECTPEHLLYIRQIKRELPDAKIIHIIRDGRDVALSFSKQGWTHPLPWDRGRELLVTGLYWKWFVFHGRKQGRRVAPDYKEVRFEDLVRRPREVLATISSFIHHELDYDRIRKSAIGSVSQPNTSFPNEPAETSFEPIGRWKKSFSQADLEKFESLVGDFMEELGYPIASNSQRSGASLDEMRLQATYPVHFDLKQWLKSRTPLGRFTSTRLFRAHAGEVRPNYASKNV